MRVPKTRGLTACLHPKKIIAGQELVPLFAGVVCPDPFARFEDVEDLSSWEEVSLLESYEWSVRPCQYPGWRLSTVND